jgi:hypothetical protein
MTKLKIQAAAFALRKVNMALWPNLIGLLAVSLSYQAQCVAPKSCSFPFSCLCGVKCNRRARLPSSDGHPVCLRWPCRVSLSRLLLYSAAESDSLFLWLSPFDAVRAASAQLGQCAKLSVKYRADRTWSFIWDLYCFWWLKRFQHLEKCQIEWLNLNFFPGF